jgi:beta-lactamase class A
VVGRLAYDGVLPGGGFDYRLRRGVVLVVFCVVVVGVMAVGPFVPSAKARERRPPDVAAAPPPPNLLDTPGIQSYLATRTGDITMALYDDTNGRTYLYRPGVTETTASIIKVDILATLLHQAVVAGQPLDQQTADLATTMIENSDDNAATALWNQAGGPTGVGAFNAGAGLTGTALNAQGYWGLSTTSAADQLAVLQTLVFPNDLLDDPSRSYELGLMENDEADQQWGVSGGVPSGVTVALKDGWDPIGPTQAWQVNSIGWINGQGRDYLLAVLTDGNATEGYGISTIEGVAGLVWQELAPPPTSGA